MIEHYVFGLNFVEFHFVSFFHKNTYADMDLNSFFCQDLFIDWRGNEEQRFSFSYWKNKSRFFFRLEFLMSTSIEM